MLAPTPKDLLALCALALLSTSTGVNAQDAPSSSSSAVSGEKAFFKSYVDSRLASYHAHVAPRSPSFPSTSSSSSSFSSSSPSSLSPRSGFALIPRAPKPASHRSHPSIYSSSAQAKGKENVTYHPAPLVSVKTEAQEKVARLAGIKAASQGFAKKAKRSEEEVEKVRRSATTGEVEKRSRQRWKRSSDPATEEDAEGDDDAEEGEGEEEGGDWTWMEGQSNHEDVEREMEAEEEEGVLSSAARMEVRMKRSLPLFKRGA
ncbi:hypothetical protein JCM8547_003382 [Rhodosporidiobolus lusitaniae]